MGTDGPGGMPQDADAVVALVGLGDAALGALIAGDGPEADRLTGARWPRPLAPPPLAGDHLDLYRDRLRSEGPVAGWWLWAIVERGRGEVAGMCSLGGPPGPDGAVEVGYSLYPRARGRGLATRAVRLAMPLALDLPGAEIVRARVPVGNLASVRVAERAGLEPAGSVVDPALGPVLLLEARRR